MAADAFQGARQQLVGHLALDFAQHRPRMQRIRRHLPGRHQVSHHALEPLDSQLPGVGRGDQCRPVAREFFGNDVSSRKQVGRQVDDAGTNNVGQRQVKTLASRVTGQGQLASHVAVVLDRLVTHQTESAALEKTGERVVVLL